MTRTETEAEFLVGQVHRVGPARTFVLTSVAEVARLANANCLVEHLTDTVIRTDVARAAWTLAAAIVAKETLVAIASVVIDTRST